MRGLLDADQTLPSWLHCKIAVAKKPQTVRTASSFACYAYRYRR
jgi:hypothetical protein